MIGDKKFGMCLVAHMACLCLLGLAIDGLWPLPAYSQQRPSPLPVVVGQVVEQAVATEIEVVGTVEPHLATTLSTEIAGLHCASTSARGMSSSKARRWWPSSKPRI